MALVEGTAGLCGLEGSCRGYGGSSSELWTECCGRKGLPVSAEPSPAQLYGAITASCPSEGKVKPIPRTAKSRSSSAHRSGFVRSYDGVWHLVAFRASLACM